MIKYRTLDEYLKFKVTYELQLFTSVLIKRQLNFT